DTARRVVVDPVTHLVGQDVDRADPATGGVLADLDLGAVVVRVLVVQADADRPGAAVAVHAVAAEPVGQHVPLGLRGEQGVDAAGLTVGRGPVAPVVVRTGERGVVGRVLAGQVGGVRVLHRVRAAAERGVQVHRVR